METNAILEKQDRATHRVPATAADAAGVIPSIVGAGVDLAQNGVRTTVGLIGEVRGQTAGIVNQSIDFAESLARALFGFGRRGAAQLDNAAAESLATVERVAMTALGAVRATSEQAAKLAMTVAEGAVSPRRAADGPQN